MEPTPTGGPPESRLPNRLEGVLRPISAWTAGGKRGIAARLAASVAALAVPLAGLLVLAALVCVLSKTPGKTLFFFLLGPFGNVYNFGNMLNAAIPLMLGALGVSIAMKTGSMNLGGEGQIYSGAFVSTAAALQLAGFGFFGGAAAVCGGALFAGAIAALSGLLKARWKTNELITSFLLSNCLILVVNFFVNGPFLDPETNLQSTRKIAAALRLPQILPPSNLSAALFVALAAVVIVQIFLSKTRLGYEFRIAGINAIFARYGGINTKFNTVLAMFFSGALYGLAGSLAVFGTYYGTVKEFSAGLGWNGLAVALIARFYPPAVVPASLFFAWISTGARIAMQNSDITFEVASIVQAVIFFLAASMSVRSVFSTVSKKRGR